MHEWSIASGIVRAVLKFMEEKGIGGVEEVVVRVGELAQLDVEILSEAFKLISEETPLKGAKLKVEVEPARFRCQRCGAEWGMGEVLEQLRAAPLIPDEEGGLDPPIHYMPELVYAFAKCPRCGSRDFSTISGMGVKVVRLKLQGGEG